MKKGKFKQLILTALVAANLITSNIAVQAVSSTQVNKTATVESQVSSSGQAVNPNWGLGSTQSEYVSNNKSYNWCIDQGNTGTYSNNNCGPSSVTMALKWRDEKFSKTAEDARNSNKKSGGWWSTDDITHYLDSNGGKYTVEALAENSLKADLSDGNIAILCIKAGYISYNNKTNQRVGRFYEFEGGHFIVVKGYRVVDGKTYFEVYDPNNWGEHYQDGQEKGKDRYYLSKDLMEAARNHWNYSITVKSAANSSTKNSTKSSDSNKSSNSTNSTDSNKSSNSTNSTNSTKSTDSSKSTKTTKSNDLSDLTEAANSSFWYWFNWFY